MFTDLIISAFENDIRNGTGSWKTRASASDAAKQLLKRSEEAFMLLTERLASLPEPENELDVEVRCAFALLLVEMGQRLDLAMPERTEYSDRASWVEWARKRRPN